jgi:hypothetical protein
MRAHRFATSKPPYLRVSHLCVLVNWDMAYSNDHYDQSPPAYGISISLTSWSFWGCLGFRETYSPIRPSLFSTRKEQKRNRKIHEKITYTSLVITTGGIFCFV